MTSEPIIKCLTSPASSLPSFVALSAGTEFKHYKEAEWSFLLKGSEIISFVVLNGNDPATVPNECDKLKGCVLRVLLDESTIALGMVLVEPTMRRRGIARCLIVAAREWCDARGQNKGTRCVLAVCARMAVPLYRQLGFEECGMVTALSCSLSVMQAETNENYNESVDKVSVRIHDGAGCSPQVRQILFSRDRAACGYDRSERIQLLLEGYASNSTTTIAFAYNGNDPDGTVCGVAVSRQDEIGGPIIVGPMSGQPIAVLPLLSELSRHHPVKGDPSQISMQIMLVDKPDLLQKLLQKGLVTSFDGPAMSTDGNGVYCKGDGSYLALMHPTLG